jgi:sec-independent protein translocase protein TatC
MFFLKKIFQLRDHVNPEHEKPFLEHLEDLRVMITRIVITLVISMLACFSFQEKLMEVLRRPVEQVWMDQLLAKLPQGNDGVAQRVDVDTWERAKAVEHAVLGLDAAQRESFFQALGDDGLRFHAQAVQLLRAVLALPKDKQDGFVGALAVADTLKGQVRALLKTAPSPEIDNRGNLRLMSALKPTETFMLSMKLSFFAGIVVSFPLLLMYVLQFVLPGLHSNEKHVLWPSLAVGFGLFLGGVLFAYYGVLPRALGFFYEWSGKLGVSNDWRIGEYITFATQFTLLFGLSFELPVVVMVLVKLGLLSYETMSRTRSYAIVAIFVAAAILTPTPDIFTLSLMAAPMIVLYEICIWLAWWDGRKARAEEATEAAQRSERLLHAVPAISDESSYDNGHDASYDSWRNDYPDLVGLAVKEEVLPEPEPAVSGGRKGVRRVKGVRGAGGRKGGRGAGGLKGTRSVPARGKLR